MIQFMQLQDYVGQLTVQTETSLQFWSDLMRRKKENYHFLIEHKDFQYCKHLVPIKSEKVKTFKVAPKCEEKL